ncbi:MAG: methyltransferase domain-containing protein [Pseudonocardia sp.]
MSLTVPEAQWRSRAHALADDIASVDALHDPRWRDAILDVPRHVLVPRYYTDEPDGPTARRWVAHEPIDDDTTRTWLDAVYSRTTLVTAIADLTDRGTQAAVSSSTKPDLMIRMLEALEVTDGMRVLEIGTGTGYNAALLAHRLGAPNVFSVEVDPALVADTRARLDGLGYGAVTLAAVDGADGLPDHAPYDRIIATCALSAVPPSWITQLTPGGLALVHIEGPLGAGNLLALRHVASDTVQGRFLPWWGCFMSRRATAGPAVGAPRPRRTKAAPSVRYTRVDPARLDGGERFPFLAQLHLPPGVFRSRWRADDHTMITEVRSPDGSWAQVTRTPDDTGSYLVREAGPTPLWACVEHAWEQWAELDDPPWHEFGLTATPTTHHIWHRNPHGRRWTLPTPGIPGAQCEATSGVRPTPDQRPGPAPELR